MGGHDNTTPVWGRPILLIFLIALGVRVAAVLWVGNWSEPSPGERFEVGWETGRVAYHLAEGNGFSLDFAASPTGHAPTAWLAPAYPWIVSLFFRAFGSYSSTAILGVLLLQALLSSLNVLVLSRLGAALGRSRAGIWAAGVLALSPSAINMSSRILWSTSLLTLLASTLMLWIVRHRERPTWPRALGIGFLTGLTLLTEPTPAAFILGAALWSCRGASRSVRLQVSFAAGIAFLCILPWVDRNARVMGSVFLMKSNLGNELYVGNGPGATGDYVRPFALIRQREGPEALDHLRALPEVERSEELGRRATSWIRSHPLEFATLTLRRFRLYWLRPMLDDWGVLGLGAIEGMVAEGYRLGSLGVLALAFLGSWRAIRSGAATTVLVIYVGLFPVAYYLTHVSITRYRFPVLPGVFLLAALAFDSLAPRREHLDGSRSSSGA